MSGFLVAPSVSTMALLLCFSTASPLAYPCWLRWLDRIALVRPERVAQREPIGAEQCPRCTGVIHQGEHEKEDNGESDEQRAAPTRQHPCPEGGYAQERKPHERAIECIFEYIEDGPGSVGREDIDRVRQEIGRRAHEGQCEARRSQPSVTWNLSSVESHEKHHHPRYTESVGGLDQVPRERSHRSEGSYPEREGDNSGHRPPRCSQQGPKQPPPPETRRRHEAASLLGLFITSKW